MKTRVRWLGLLLGALAPLVAAAEGLTLERAVEVALEKNERAAVAAAGERTADASVARARAYYFPTVSFTAGYTRRPYEVSREVGGEEVIILNNDIVNGAIDARMPLYDASGRTRKRLAEADRAVATSAAEDARRALTVEVAAAFFGCLGQEQVVTAATKRRDLAQERLTTAKARYGAGLVSANDVTQAELALAQAELELTRSQGSAELAYLRLGYLMNEEVKGPLTAPSDFVAAALLPQEADSLLKSAEARPDVEAEKRRASSAVLAAKEPTARRYPSLWLNAQLRGNSNPGLSGRFDDEFIGLSATWSLYDGTWSADQTTLDAASEQAALRAQLTERAASLEVRSALVSLRVAQAASAQAQVALDAAAKNAEESGALYERGLTTALNVADADGKLFEAEVEVVRQRYDLALTYVELRRAAGLDIVRVSSPRGEASR